MSFLNELTATLELHKPFENIFQETEKFDLILNECGANEKEVVFLICDSFGVSLEVAERIAYNTPITIKESITKTEAESLKEKFEGVGATIELRESTKFSVALTDLGSQSVKVLKQLGELLNISVESVMSKAENLPLVITESASHLEAEKILCKLENVGATVEIHKL